MPRSARRDDREQRERQQPAESDPYGVPTSFKTRLSPSVELALLVTEQLVAADVAPVVLPPAAIGARIHGGMIIG